MINKERVKLLYDDLMTGNHKQTTGALQHFRENGNSFCCLGRACHVAKDNGLPLIVEPSATANTMAFKSADSTYPEIGLMPVEVAQWYGFDDVNPTVGFTDDNGVKLTSTLATLNDGDTPLGIRSHSLQEIADIIKQNFLD